MFRPHLDAAFAFSDGAQGERPPCDPVMMFKVLVIQTTNNLSDERAEFLINDRLLFMRFPGLGLSDRIPDVRRTCAACRPRLRASAAFCAFEGTGLKIAVRAMRRSVLAEPPSEKQ